MIFQKLFHDLYKNRYQCHKKNLDQRIAYGQRKSLNGLNYEDYFVNWSTSMIEWILCVEDQFSIFFWQINVSQNNVQVVKENGTEIGTNVQGAKGTGIFGNACPFF